MNILYYLRNKGINNLIRTVWRYKIDKVLIATINFFLKKKPLSNSIILESHNDFDCNCGAFYNYLINNNFNQKYRIVWVVKNDVYIHATLPYNVTVVPLFKPSIKKDYYLCTSKYILCDCEILPKVRGDQVSIYTTHGGCTFKNVKGLLVVPDYVDYVLCSSHNYAPLMCKNYSIPYPNKKMVNIGFPLSDSLFDDNKHDLQKITKIKYDKVFLWMPTFRKTIGGREDSHKNDIYGVPLIQSEDDIHRIDNFLKKQKAFLVVKYHPMQDLSDVIIPKGFTNIIFLTAAKVKELNIDNYALMRDCDALISDYSSAAYTFLLLNRPIGFVISDLDEYKPGFSIEDFDRVLVGQQIQNVDSFISFITNCINGEDLYEKKRTALLQWLYEYHDGRANERLANFLKL